MTRKIPESLQDSGIAPGGAIAGRRSFPCVKG